jgi:hypothetical protein
VIIISLRLFVLKALGRSLTSNLESQQPEDDDKPIDIPDEVEGVEDALRSWSPHLK